MKRKLLVLVLALFIPFGLMLSACGENTAIQLTSDMLSLQYTTISYDGTEKQPTITVKIEEEVVPSTEYIVLYSNNTEVGTATVTVTANDDSEIISGSASVNFEITAISTTAADYDNLTTVLASSNYNRITLTENITIPEGCTLNVPEGKIVNCGNYVIVNNGTIINNGTISTNVNSVASLKAAYEFANEINVTEDIKSNDASYLGDIRLTATNRDYDFSLYLNGHTIEAELDFVNYVSGSEGNNNVVYTDYGINAKISNGKIGGTLNDAGILVKGNKKINIELINCELEGTDAGLLTNGNCKGATITALSCNFIGNNLDDSAARADGASGVYLPSQDIFNFTNCTFTGLTGYYAKSGSHKLTACTFNATAAEYTEPSHNGNGCNETGSALVIDSAANYQSPLNVEIIGGTCNSNAYGIEVYTTGATTPYSTINIIGTVNYNVELENIRNWYDTWTGNTTEISTADAVENVIEIKTAAQLAGLAKAVNEGETFEGYTIKLASDIDLNNIEFTPIGYGSYSNGTDTINNGYIFKGTFNGQNHTIYNLKITNFNKGGEADGTSAGIGLFGNAVNCTIENVKINGATIEGNHYVAAIAGFAAGSIINNCSVENANINCSYINDDESGDKAGLIVGYIGSTKFRTSSVTNCSGKNSTVSADRDAAQLIGAMAKAGTLSGNTAINVIVEWNESSTGFVDSSYTKENTNIKNEIVGKVS